MALIETKDIRAIREMDDVELKEYIESEIERGFAAGFLIGGSNARKCDSIVDLIAMHLASGWDWFKNISQ